nr:hypothetical protein [Tanacetum cinerariifolium]
MKESKSHLRADYKRELFDALVNSYNTDKDLFNTYGYVFTLKRSNNDEQLEDEAAPKNDWLRKLERPLTPDLDWSKRQHVNFPLPQTWSSVTARVEKPPTSFDELTDTPIDFSEFFMNQLIITNLTQVLLVGPAFNLLKGGIRKTCLLGYFTLGVKRQLFYRFASNRESTKDVYPGKQIIAVTRLKIMKKYDYGQLDEIEVRKEDQQLYTFKEGDFIRLRLQHIEDMNKDGIPAKEEMKWTSQAKGSGMKRRKSSKESKSLKDQRLKEGKSSNSSKGTSRSHHKSSGKSDHAEEPSHTVDDSRVQKNQEFDTGNDD